MFKSVIVCSLLVAIFSFQIQRQPAILVDSESLSAINWPFDVCGKGNWTPESLTLAATPKRNSKDDIVVTGTANDSVAFSKVALEVRLNNVYLHSEDVEFTDSYDDGDTVEFKYQNFIPSFAPPGTYGITFNFKNSDGKDEGCINFSFKI